MLYFLLCRVVENHSDVTQMEATVAFCFRNELSEATDRPKFTISREKKPFKSQTRSNILFIFHLIFCIQKLYLHFYFHVRFSF